MPTRDTPFGHQYIDNSRGLAGDVSSVAKPINDCSHQLSNRMSKKYLCDIKSGNIIIMYTLKQGLRQDSEAATTNNDAVGT